MNLSKIAANIIIKNDDEVEKLERCLKSIAPFVDGLFIQVNNNPYEKVQALCRKYGATLDIRIGEFSEVATQEQVDWLKDYFGWEPHLKAGDPIFKFGEARQAILDKTPDNYNWLFWIDSDDVLRDGDLLHEIANTALARNCEAVFFNYLYQVESQYGKMILNEFTEPKTVEGERITNVVIQHLRERLVRIDGDYRNVFKWVGNIHETLIQQRETKKEEDPRASVLHLSSIEKFQEAIKRNIRVLEYEIWKTQAKDPRPIYYLGKTYFDLQTPEDRERAQKLMLDYISPDAHKGNMSGWAEERAQAWEYIAEIYRAKGEHRESIKALLRALYEYPQFPSTYFSLAGAYLLLNEFERARYWATLGKAVPRGRTTLVSNPRDDDMRYHMVMYQANLNTGRSDEAFESAKALKEMFPNDPGFDQQWQFINNLMQQKKLFIGFMDLAQHLNQSGQMNKLKPLLLAAPNEIANNPSVISLYQQVYPPMQWLEDELVIYCGQQFTLWGPDHINDPKGTFIGGSEEAVIHAAEALAKKGWKVTVYADPPEDQVGVKNGVDWRPYFEFNARDKFNVLIFWRAPGYLDMKPEAKQVYLWAHDVQSPVEWSAERLSYVTKIIVLSEAHRKNLPEVPDDKFLISSNGYTEYLPEIKPDNNPKWCIYTSSYDRGLQNLLEVWPDVIAEVPDAQLHIFYGWMLFAKFYNANPERMAWMEKMNELMKLPGVTNHDRVSQPEMERWYKQCGLFTYPAHFYEINCISAIKAQAFGAVPVVTDYAALHTTVQSGKKVEGEIYDNVCLSPEAKEAYKKSVIKALKTPNWQEEQRIKGKAYASQFTWDNVISDWDNLFREEAKKWKDQDVQATVETVGSANSTTVISAT